MNGLNDNKTVSNINSGFPDYLDFDRLRSEGIDLLGKLSGKIWTDHNVHDPGITILEVLCYALMDLGYRTNLPFNDILSGDPNDRSADKNFFTASRIFACNPVTITDFRKLLTDLAGVRNAWLEVADDFDPRTFCEGNDMPEEDCCVNYLNGLYHVYIETEKKSGDDAEQIAFDEDVVKKVRIALMAHRNLAEDFVDIKVLCRIPVGVCADIELDEAADPETLYVQLVDKLSDFFSPAPKFYTLQQLVEEKHRSIEEIFAGRPYNLAQSHGFIDTDEFESIRLKKRIQLSDVYSAIFEVSGVRTVTRLSFRTCDGKLKLQPESWAFDVPRDHVPEFSATCSGFRFTRRGIPLNVDFKKYAGLFELDFRNSGKVPYKNPSPYLDFQIPKGTFHQDLGDYYSVQNDFPKVYGISEGGITANASPSRQARALQLKGYLLFFDQLLANYAMQLKGIRQLFNLSITDAQNQQTYFTKLPESVPDLQKLLSFSVDPSQTTTSGTEGSILAIPVDRNELEAFVAKSKSCTDDVKKELPQFFFNNAGGVETALNTLVNDLLYADYEPVVFSHDSRCWFFGLVTSSYDFALVSRHFYESERDAKAAAATLKYAGTFSENFKIFGNASTNQYSFDVELNVAVYSKYLQLLAEDKDLYNKRRHQFLDHLLSRFAESFTDYAMLSYGIYNEEQVDSGNVEKKERFLTSYEALSSERGKAYDYLQNGWNNDNISGLEQKFKALAGIDNWKRHNLCHFEVYQYQPQFVSMLKIGGEELFAVEGKFETREDAEVASRSLFNALSDPASYLPVYIPQERAYTLEVCFSQDRKAYLRKNLANEDEAKSTAGILQEVFASQLRDENIFVSRYQYRAQLKDCTGNTVANFVSSYTDSGKALSEGVKKINVRKNWNYIGEEESAAGSFHAIDETGRNFINVNAFKTDISDTIIDKPNKFSYEVLDRNNQFKFHSVNEFDSPDLARKDCRRSILALARYVDYRISENSETKKHRINIFYKDQLLATHSKEFSTESDAQKMAAKIKSIVNQHLYTLDIEEIPDRWKFRFRLGLAENDVFDFVADNEGYESPDDTRAAATSFLKESARLELSEGPGVVRLVPGNKKTVATVRLETMTDGSPSEIRESISRHLAVRKSIMALRTAGPEAFSASVDVDEQSRCGQYVYHLVDNDNVIAFSSLTPHLKDKGGAEPERKSLIQKGAAGYEYLEIAMGGDIIRKRKNKNTKAITYHYQLKTLRPLRKSGDANGKMLVLFESSQGYETSEAAETAFHENYLRVLMYARDLNNYLTTKLIGDKESVINDNCCTSGHPIVFIPKDTLDYLGGYTEDAEKEMVRIVNTFPIRMTEYDPDNEKFKSRFPCERGNGNRNGKRDSCSDTQMRWVYYFVLYDKETEKEDWQSTKFYESADEARTDFLFFLVLLNFEGNYWVECDTCDQVYKIFIREVLAESAGRFETPDKAWGSDGIQKFICTAQTEGSFHTYQNKRNCCYSFFVGCQRTPLYHPCHYDSPDLRDKAMDLLFYSFQKYHSLKLPYLKAENDAGTLYSGDDNPVATIVYRMHNMQGWLNCGDPTVALMHFILTEDTCVVDGGLEIRFDDENYIRITSIDGAEEIQQLRAKLERLAWYYPIVLDGEVKPGKVASQFCIEIKYPGLNPRDPVCGCDEYDNDAAGNCHVAWKSACCFPSCEDALNFYTESVVILSDYDSYRAVFECNCGPYGIGLYHHPDLLDCRDKNSERYVAREKYQLIAVNPQCYPTPEMACKAVERAKARINDEGLFLVEHILLRPHCREECECEFYRKERCDETGCEFVWNPSVEDPCKVTSPVCFVPGSDPYSFIVTVALPAWPERFRKKESRKLVESLLQREAPAHVLLRILWLAPHDLCCFQHHYKKWIMWIAGKSQCEQFRVCDFLDFLFNRNFECLSDCMVCNACPQDEVVSDPCPEDNEVIDRCFPKEFRQLNQINEIFCWTKTDCCNYRYLECDHGVMGDRVTDVRNVFETQDSETEESIPPAETGLMGTSVQSQKVKAIDRAFSEKARMNFINQRLTRYKGQVNETAAGLRNKPSRLVAGMTESFLMDNDPSVERLRDLTDDILRTAKPKGKAKSPSLKKEDAEKLIRPSVYHFLDRKYFSGENLTDIKKLADVFKKMKAAGFDMSLVYNEWQPDDIKRYESKIDLTMIRSLMARGK